MKPLQTPIISQQATLSPTDRYKQLIIKLLEDSIDYDCELSKEKFIKSVKNLAVILRSYYSDPIHNQIREMINELNKKIKEIKGKELNEAQKRIQIVEESYKVYEDLFILAIDTINNSPIVEKEVEGILVYKDMKDLKELAKKIKQPINIEAREEE